MIHCEWKDCHNKAEYLINWNNCSRPAIIKPFANYNLLCEKHLKESKNMFHNLKPLEIYELTDPVIKVTFT